jgi:hypothetical protein
VNPLPRHLASAALLLAFSPATRFANLALVHFALEPPPPQLPALAHNGPALANRSARAFPLDPIDGDVVRSERAGERRAAGAGP